MTPTVAEGVSRPCNLFVSYGTLVNSTDQCTDWSEQVSAAATSGGLGLSPSDAFSSLAQARDAVRLLNATERCGGVTVTILSGEFGVREGIGSLHLDHRDSGCPGAPIVYRGVRGADGSAASTLHAGVQVPASAFHPVTVDGISMFRADVRPYGVSTFGEFSHPAENGQCVMTERSSVYYDKQPQTLARHPNIDRSTGNFQWMRVGAVTSFSTFASSQMNDTIAAQRWINDTSGDVWLHGFWMWDWADTFQRVKRILAPPSNNYLHASWGADYAVPTVAACGLKHALSPLQQQWEFKTVNTTIGNISNILANDYATMPLPSWAGGAGKAEQAGPVIFNCQKQLIYDPALADGAGPSSVKCTSSGNGFQQYQLELNESSGQLKSGIPANAPGRHTSYGFGEDVCVAADEHGLVSLAPCVVPVPANQRWVYDSITRNLKVAGLGLSETPHTHNSQDGLCLTFAPHTVSYELDTVGEPPRSTSYNITSGSRYYALNALGMLDDEGEYYFDEATKYLYFKPPTIGRVTSDVYISVNATVVNLTDVHDVVLQDMNILYAKTLAVRANNVSGVTIRNVSIGLTSGQGMVVSGANTLIEGCHIYGIGCSAMSIEGGDRITLTAGNITVKGNVIHDWALVSRSYEGGIGFGGCGNAVIGNELFNAPHTAITGSGNNFYFANNHVHDVCRGTADAGAFYVGRTWASLGNTIEQNVFNRTANVEEMAQHTQTVGVYLDDGDSGWLLQDNYFGNSPMCVLMGGGRNNTVLRNYFDHCDLGIDIGERNAAADTNPINGTFLFGRSAAEGVPGGIVSALHINDPNSVWGRAYGPSSPRPFNWTYRCDGPAFDHVADNRYVWTPFMALSIASFHNDAT